MGKFIPEELSERQLMLAASHAKRTARKLKALHEGKGELHSMLRDMHSVEKKVAVALIEDPFASPTKLSSMFKVPYNVILKAMESEQVKSVIRKNSERDEVYLQRVRMKARKVIENHVDKDSLMAAMYVEKKTFDAPQVVNIQVPVMTPNALRDLAKKVIDVTPSQPVDNSVHSPVDKSSDTAVNNTTGHDEFPLD